MEPSPPLAPPDLRKLAYHKGSRTMVRFIRNEIFRDRVYLQHGLTLKPGATVIDAGANIGLFAIFCDQVCGGDCTVYSFEPIPETARLLRKNVAQLGSGGQFEVIEAGLTDSEEKTETEFMYLPQNPGGSTYKTDAKISRITGRTQRWLGKRNHLIRVLLDPWVRFRQRSFDKCPRLRCKLTTLSRACADFDIRKIDLLKIDVEDAELDVVRGINDETWPLIQQVVMEVHLTERLTLIEDILRGQGFLQVQVDPARWDAETFTLYARR